MTSKWSIVSMYALSTARSRYIEVFWYFKTDPAVYRVGYRVGYTVATYLSFLNRFALRFKPSELFYHNSFYSDIAINKYVSSVSCNILLWHWSLKHQMNGSFLGKWKTKESCPLSELICQRGNNQQHITYLTLNLLLKVINLYTYNSFRCLTAQHQ